MLEIKFDPSTLSKAQREDLASFILGWDTVTETPKLAPSSADADPSRIAPVDTQDHTLAGTAPPPPVPQPGLLVNTAAPPSLSLAEVDSKCMPWDARIHSSSKAKVADGTWKYRRGVSDEEVKRVEAELHNPTLEEVFTNPIPSQSASTIRTPFDNVDLSLNAEKFIKPGSGTAPPPPLGALPAMSGGGGGVGAVSPASGVTTNVGVDLRKEFAQLMIRVAQAKGAGKITAEEVTAALAAHNVPSLPMLSTKLDQVPAVAAAIDEIIASRG